MKLFDYLAYRIERPFAKIFCKMIQTKINRLRTLQSWDSDENFQKWQFRIITLTDFRDEICTSYKLNIEELC